jgi:hypothetical protein
MADIGRHSTAGMNPVYQASTSNVLFACHNLPRSRAAGTGLQEIARCHGSRSAGLQINYDVQGLLGARSQREP